MTDPTPPTDPAPAPRPRVALIAHDGRKAELVEWCAAQRDGLARCALSATGATGALIARTLGLEVHAYRSGPRGGDQEVGAAIAGGVVDALVFFWDPLAPQPHDVDVKALLRIAVLCDVVIACNRPTADLAIPGLLARTPSA